MNNSELLASSAPFVSVPEQIWRMARTAPEALAVISGCRRVTFSDLIARASALADSFPVVRGDAHSVVAIATDDCLELIVGALAAWRVGCAYLPVDPAGPPIRLGHMLMEAGVQLVIGNATALSHIPPGAWRQLPISEFASANDRPFPAADLGLENWNTQPNDLAYIIYTSGSTGQSKGVAVTHANLSHLVQWHQSAFDVGPRDKGTQFAALTFDAAVLETWPLLAVGASLYVPERSIPLVPERLRDYLVAQGITICFAVTPIAESLLSLKWPQETRLRYLLTGADALHTFAPAGIPFRLVNNYGPTECTVVATSGLVPVEKGETAVPSIGKPITGTEVYLLDSEMQPVPDGQLGQICIGGVGVSAGYVGHPDLTAEKFRRLPSISKSPLYLTGDLGREHPSGDLEFCGRLDDQIKLRGYRIEPGEIVAALRSHPAVSSAAVVTVGNEANKQLAAYVVPKFDIMAADLRDHLRARVPSYMIPDHFVRLNELPVTAHGKIDRKALPLPDRSNTLDEQTGSLGELQTEIQSQVASILSNLLGGRELRLEDNFFHAGGHSLLAAQIIARVRNAFEVDLPLRTVFESPTVATLSQQIETRILDAVKRIGTEPRPYGSGLAVSSLL